MNRVIDGVKIAALDAMPTRVLATCRRCGGTGGFNVSRLGSWEWEECGCTGGRSEREMSGHERVKVARYIAEGGRLDDLLVTPETSA